MFEVWCGDTNRGGMMSYFDDGYPVDLCEHGRPGYCHRCAVESGLEEEDGEP